MLFIPDQGRAGRLRFPSEVRPFVRRLSFGEVRGFWDRTLPTSDVVQVGSTAFVVLIKCLNDALILFFIMDFLILFYLMDSFIDDFVNANLILMIILSFCKNAEVKNLCGSFIRGYSLVVQLTFITELVIY